MARSDKNKKKIRVRLKKNRVQRARERDLTRRVLNEEDALADLPTDERLSGKGELTRQRTIISDEEESGPRRAVDSARSLEGRVVSAVGANNCRIHSPDGRHWTCTVRRIVRTVASDSRTAVVAGDRVLFTPTGPERGVVERVEPRVTTLTRVSRNQAHVLVANVDQAVIVASVAEPDLKLPLIDRFLAGAEKGGIAGIICINKVDLGQADLLQSIVGQYGRLGYPVVLTSAREGIGVEELRGLLKGHETVFTGQSGVGKSSLLNALQPELDLGVSDVSPETQKGRHTTRVASLLPLQGGGWLVDTPGIRQLQLWDVAREEVEGLFIEFRPFVTRCRFPNCTHLHENACGVRVAVQRGQISPLRYHSYMRMMTSDD